MTRSVSGIGNDVEASLKSLSGTLGVVLASGATLSTDEVVVHESLNGRIVSKRKARVDEKGLVSFEPHPAFEDAGGYIVPPFKATAKIR